MLLAECSHVFFFNDTATTEIYTLSLHDALPIYRTPQPQIPMERCIWAPLLEFVPDGNGSEAGRSEEHTSELQSLAYLVCRLLLEKKNDYPFLITATLLCLLILPVMLLHRRHAKR